MRAYFLIWLAFAGAIPVSTVTALAIFRPDYLMTVSAQFCPAARPFGPCHVTSICVSAYAMAQSCFAALVCDLLPLFFALTFNAGFGEVNGKLKALTEVQRCFIFFFKNGFPQTFRVIPIMF